MYLKCEMQVGQAPCMAWRCSAEGSDGGDGTQVMAVVMEVMAGAWVVEVMAKLVSIATPGSGPWPQQQRPAQQF